MLEVRRADLAPRFAHRPAILPRRAVAIDLTQKRRAFRYSFHSVVTLFSSAPDIASLIRAPLASTDRVRCEVVASLDYMATFAAFAGVKLLEKGPEAYVATVPQVFDLWQDPQERYDIFMNNYTEHTWIPVTISDSIKELMKTYVQYPPRKLQSESYAGPITLTQYEHFQFVRDQLVKQGVTIPLSTGN
jgi:hypothetical protein